jgi:hypothetical protein
MKRIFIICILGVLASGTFADYSIDWHTIDGGGGMSTGGDYSLVGSIGQHDADTVAVGGDYTLSGGFWPGGPTLALCFVNFEDFAQLAMYWLDGPCDASNNWCGGADLDSSGDVTITDLNELAYFWLSVCPEDWP